MTTKGIPPLLDPRRRKSEDLAFRAEREWAAGAREEARRLFTEAASIEFEVAMGAPDTAPKARGILAVSAASLWYKAGEFARAKRVAYTFLATDSLTESARAELEQLAERCSRESELLKLTNDAGMVPVEIKLQGGRVGVGVAPEGVARRRRDAFASLLMRTAELEANHVYRDRGQSELHRNEDIELLEVPALAASYGVRFYVSTGAQQKMPSEQVVTPARVVERFLTLAGQAAAGPAALRRALGDEQYANAFLAGFGEIAPDGADVATVACSAPTWMMRSSGPVFDPSHRRDLIAAVTDPALRDARPGEKLVEGVLTKVQLMREQGWAELDVGEEKPTVVAINDKRLRAKAATLRASPGDIRVRVYATVARAGRLIMTDIAGLRATLLDP